MNTRTRGKEIIPLDLELERTLRQRKKETKVETEATTITPTEFTMADQPPPDPMAAIMRALEEIKAEQAAVKAKEEAEKNKVPLNQAYRPPVKAYTNGGWGSIEANNFELKPSLIHMIQKDQFGGRATEDPNDHLESFLEVCDTIKQNGVPTDTIRLRMFGFSLRDDAKQWFKRLDRGKISTWEELCTSFLNEFFPPSKAQKLLGELHQFSQFANERLYEVWKRFQDLLRQCPQHGLPMDQQLILFYNGLNEATAKDLDVAANGSFLERDVDNATQILETMVTTGQQWRKERGNVKRISSAQDDSKYDDLMERYAMLERELEEERRAKAQVSAIADEEVSYVQQGNYRQGAFRGNMAYNPNNRSHPNFSYANPNNALQPPPGFNVKNGVIQEPKKLSPMEEMMQELMAQQKEYAAKSELKFGALEHNLTALGKTVVSMSKQLNMVENQVGQMANDRSGVHKPGQFPSNTEVNPKNHQQCSAIQLRSGSKYVNYPATKGEVEGKTASEDEDQIVEKSSDFSNQEKAAAQTPLGLLLDREGGREGPPIDTEDPLGPDLDREPSREAPGVKKPLSLPTYTPKAPFPQRLAKTKYDEKLQQFIEMFQKVNINIPLLDALRDMPGYVKFLKDAVASKKKLGKFETINLTEECSAVLQRKLPLKQKDPGRFTLQCMIGDHTFNNVLCDLGASINLMPLSIFNRLKIGAMKPTTISLLMANRSVTYPKGIVEDVLVKVDKFVFPADFVVLDMPEDRNQPLILGRPFLATGRALIDVQDGDLTFRVNEEELKISLYDAMKKHDDSNNYECFSIDVMESPLAKPEDVLEHCIQNSIYSSVLDEGDTSKMPLYVPKASFAQQLVKPEKDGPMKFYEDKGSTKFKELQSLKKGCSKKMMGESQSLKEDHLRLGEIHVHGRPLSLHPP